METIEMAYYRNPSRSKFAKAYRAARRDWYKTHYGSDEVGFRGSKYWTGSNRRTRAAYNAWLRSQPGAGGKFNYYLQQRNKRVARFKDGVASVAFEPRVSNPSRSKAARARRATYKYRLPRKVRRATAAWVQSQPNRYRGRLETPALLKDMWGAYAKWRWYTDSRRNRALKDNRAWWAAK